MSTCDRHQLTGKLQVLLMATLTIYRTIHIIILSYSYTKLRPTKYTPVGGINIFIQKGMSTKSVFRRCAGTQVKSVPSQSPGVGLIKDSLNRYKADTK